MKQLIKNTISDLVANFLYYDRKEDEDLPLGEIEKAILSGEISLMDISLMFNEELLKSMND